MSAPSALATSNCPDRAATDRTRARISAIRSISDSRLTSRAIRSETYESKKRSRLRGFVRVTASGKPPRTSRSA
ncbi:hypothetical protein OHB01_19745 [Microbispora hainanensis]|uniref:Uncharacterized protein n=1 Tax=Microbispora hainanensis TaxID=568844 RepID=A0ABZ1T0T5_9ACTN|nr:MULTISPECIES: hypothetical protein [Microbispora]